MNDDAEREVTEWAQAHRAHFASREDYSRAICDRLAAAGVPPVPAMVLRVGRWGNTASVARDVEQWFRGVAARLVAPEPIVPLGARPLANKLIEQLWQAARSEVDERMAAPLRAELATVQEQLSLLKDELRDERLRRQQDAEASERAVSAATQAAEALQEQVATLVGKLQACEGELNAEVARHAATRAAADQNVRRLSEQLADTQSAAQAAAQALAAQAADERKRLLLLVDEARSQAKEAQRRVDDLTQQLAHSGERLMNANTELAATAARATAAEAAIEQVRATQVAERDAASLRQADLQRLVEVSRADSRRLDLVQEHLWFVEPDYSEVSPGWRVGKADHDGRPQHQGPDLRLAIDRAAQALAAPPQRHVPAPKRGKR